MTERIFSAVRSWLDWSRGLHLPAPPDADALTLVLHAHRDCGAPDPGDWTVQDVHEVAAAVHGYRGGPEALRSAWLLWCDHLVERGELTPGQSPRALREAVAEVDLVAPRLQEEEPDRTLEPLLERLGAGTRPAVDLPAVVAAPAEELDTAALQCTALSEAARLTVWIDGGRDLAPGTTQDALRLEDLAAAAEALGTGPEQVRESFAVAREAGLLRTTYTRVLPGPASRDWAARVPGAVADAWADALPLMTGLRGVLSYLVLTELFTTGTAHGPADLAASCALGSAAEVEVEVERALSVLEGLGAVTSHGTGSRGGRGPLPGQRARRITPLGDRFMVRQLTKAEVPVRVLPRVDAMSGEQALEVVMGHSRPLDTELVLSRWLTRQAEQGRLSTAVTELFDACADPLQWHRRSAVLHLVRRSATDVSGLLPFHVHHPVVGGWARRMRPGYTPDPCSHQDVWAVLDDHALLMEAGTAPAEDPRLSARAGELVRTIVLSGHPRAAHVLDLLAEGSWGAETARAAENARAAEAIM
ncbi:hypothetical protein [Nocardiopsis kunsanensis]|uniref:hypothetical protein n=1 Tax=Nocardiopsis kunsanensis TaxID=141693 RepID=UPI00034560CA|nr:hypothetical protein [Nocardiopsis kunsanensis]